jgi:hypothetical protein
LSQGTTAIYPHVTVITVIFAVGGSKLPWPSQGKYFFLGLNCIHFLFEFSNKSDKCDILSLENASMQELAPFIQF